MAPHTGSATPEQIETLLNFLDENKDLARGRLRSVEGKMQARRLWDEVCNTLNSMGSCTKTVQQWQKVWFDRKHLAKKAAADFRRSASATGGGPSAAPQLSQWELKVLAIMGDGFGSRQTEARVPAFYEINDEVHEATPSTYSQSVTPVVVPEQSVHIPVFVEIDVSEPTQQSIPASQPVLLESVTSQTTSQQTRSSRRRHAAGSSLTSRLLDLEEERREQGVVMNTELAGIRAALLELCGLIREYINKYK